MFYISAYDYLNVWKNFTGSLPYKWSGLWRKTLEYSLKRYNCTIIGNDWLLFNTEEDFTKFVLEWT